MSDWKPVVGDDEDDPMSDWKPVVGDEMRNLNAEARARSFAESADQENRAAPSMTPEPIPPNADPVQWLIDRVQAVITESTQMGTEPLSTKASVLAQLYQAQAMREMSRVLAEIKSTLWTIGTDRRSTSRPNPERPYRRRRHSRFAQIFRDMADAYEDLE